MRSIVALWTALLAVLALTTTAAAGTISAPQGCATGAVEAAAETLFGPGTEVVSVEPVASLKTALVLEPRVHPGTRHRMIAAGDGWCDATTGFNRAWQANGRSVGDGRAVAEAYARLAAAPYFDGVTVTATEAGAAGTWIMRTHALTNGVDASWVVTTDAAGVQSATWAATGFAREPFEAQWEGLTALPGLSERYVRAADGVIDDVRGLPTPESAAAASDDGQPGLLQHTFADGYTIVTSVGDAHVGLDTGVDTGISRADILRATMRASRENYEEFLSWGFSKGWRALPGYEQTFGNDVGFVYVNDALGLACLACVFISDHFQIHLNSEVQTALDLLGYDGYRDRAQAYSLIIGHEMFHNFQNRYNKPGHFNQAGRGTPTSYSEGTARFQETLHTYAETSFAPNTLLTANDANGCNGFDTGGSMAAGMAAGPFGKTYNTCFLWGPWYVSEGKAAFLSLVREAIPAHSPKPNGFGDVGAAMEQAGGEPLADQLVRFAGAAITGSGRAWSTFFGTSPLDWGALFERWAPPRIEEGRATRTLGPGGLMARELTRAAKVSVTGSANAVLYILRDDGTSLKIRPVKSLPAAVGAPEPGERVYAVVVRPAAGSEAVTLVVDGQGPFTPTAAQAPVSGTVTTLASGVGIRIAGVTSQFVQFTVPEGVENARTDVAATYPLQADIDLYLQRRNADGTWITLAAGESSSLSGESTSHEDPLGHGTYRIEVHNFAGPPGNQVSVKATFYNSAGEPGV
jgi:hypothetical protein